MSRRDKLSNHKDVKSWFAYSGKFEFSLIPCDHYLCSDTEAVLQIKLWSKFAKK